MHQFRKFLLFCGAVLLAASSSQAADFSCSAIDSSKYKDASLLYEAPNGKWTPVGNFSALGNGPFRNRNFMFVVHDAPEKNGILIVKAGRQSNRDSSVVTLDRMLKTQAQSGAGCRVPATGPYHKTVSATSYDSYHDSDQGTASEPDLAVIQNFHISYVNARQECVRTDNNKGDATSLLSMQSNRTQFSFNTSVVDNGVSQVAHVNPLWFFFGTAVAEPPPLGHRVVTMISYRTDETGYACPSFVANTGSGTFLRVLELEGRRANNYRRKEFRLKD